MHFLRIVHTHPAAKLAPTPHYPGRSVSNLFRSHMRAVRIHENGGPDVLSYDEVPVPKPAAGQVVVHNHAIGVNYIDTYHRNGLYKLSLPATLGREGAGVISAVGEGVTDVHVGDRVAYALAEGSYAEYTSMAAFRALRLPDSVSFKQGAAAMLQGMTAHMLAHSVYPLKKGDTALVLAGAGGTGSLLIQIAKMRGARVITTVSTEEKAALVRSLGADEVIVYKRAKIDEETRRLTNNRGVQVVYDGVGAATWEASINSLAPRGYLVLYGNASGPVPPFDPLLLSRKGSLFVTRPTLVNYTETADEYRERGHDVLQWLTNGRVKMLPSTEFALSHAGDAHTALESGSTTGKLLLIPPGV